MEEGIKATPAGRCSSGGPVRLLAVGEEWEGGGVIGLEKWDSESRGCCLFGLGVYSVRKGTGFRAWPGFGLGWVGGSSLIQ